MAQSGMVVEELKRELRARGLTYADVATAINMSEASVKRMFSRKDFTLKRLDQICEFAQVEFSELTRALNAEERLIAQLTEEQERELVDHPHLFLAAVCALNLVQYDQILFAYKLEPAELVRLLTRLDRIGFLQLLPNNRYKLLVARTFAWIPNGPIQRYFKEHAGDYFDSNFDGPGELMLLQNGRLSKANVAILLARLKRVAREFSEQHNEDAKLPLQQRYPLSLLLAVRPWQLRFMEDMLRVQPERTASARIVHKIER